MGFGEEGLKTAVRAGSWWLGGAGRVPAFCFVIPQLPSLALSNSNAISLGQGQDHGKPQ